MQEPTLCGEGRFCTGFSLRKNPEGSLAGIPSPGSAFFQFK